MALQNGPPCETSCQGVLFDYGSLTPYSFRLVLCPIWLQVKVIFHAKCPLSWKEKSLEIKSDSPTMNSSHL